MDAYITQNGSYLLVLKKGESVIDTLTKFCIKNEIRAATLSGLGAVNEISCGYYDLEQREYFFTQYEGDHEVVGMSGNVILKDNEPFVHLHATFTNKENNAFGGHVEHMTVAVTLEVHVHVLSIDAELNRKHDDDTGLALISSE